ncbi:MAG: PepSY domain-containing protein [Saccharofermentanales bacterium]
MGMISKKKVSVIAAAVTLLLFVCLSIIFAVSADALNKAKVAASPYLSGTSEFVSFRKSADRFNLYYFDAVKQERIEVEVSKSPQQVIKMQVQKTGHEFSDGAILDDGKLLKNFLNYIQDSSIKNIIIARSGNLKYAEITYTAADSRGAYLMNTSDGALISYTIKFSSPVVIPYSSTSGSFKILRFSELKRIADLITPGSVFQDLDILYLNEKFIAEIDLYRDGTKHVLLIDAITGRELGHESYKDRWKSYGTWEPVELITPLINITNLDASLLLPDSASEIPSGQDGSSEVDSSISSAASADPASFINSGSSASASASASPSVSSAASSSSVSAVPGVTPTSGPEATAAPTGPVIISILRVKDLVLSRLPGAVFVDAIDLDTDDDRLLYEGKARNGSVEVSFEIDAYTGTFAKWETDTLDDD